MTYMYTKPQGTPWVHTNLSVCVTLWNWQSCPVAHSECPELLNHLQTGPFHWVAHLPHGNHHTVYVGAPTLCEKTLLFCSCGFAIALHTMSSSCPSLRLDPPWALSVSTVNWTFWLSSWGRWWHCIMMNPRADTCRSQNSLWGISYCPQDSSSQTLGQFYWISKWAWSYD